MFAAIAPIPSRAEARPALAPARPLGLFRLFLAAAVVLQHFHPLLPRAYQVPFERGGLGAVAVCVFFMVSGFVIAEAATSFYAGRPFAFLANRVLRLAPPYAAALIVSIAVHIILYRSGHLVLRDFPLPAAPDSPGLLLSGALALLPGFHLLIASHRFEFIPFVWSLRVEFGFYLAVFAAMALRPIWRGAGEAALAAAAAASLVAIGVGSHGALCTAPFFLLGVLLFMSPRHARARLVLPPLLLLAAMGFANLVQRGPASLPAQLALLLLLFALLAWLAAHPMPAWFVRTDRICGDLSYPLYLNHYAVGLLAFGLAPQGDVATYVLAILASFLLAALLGAAVEHPTRRLRTRLRGVAL